MTSKYRVWYTDEAEIQRHSLRADIRRKLEELEDDLAQRGCEAGDYRLTGLIVDHFCCTRIRKVTGNWRVIFGFPKKDEIAITQVGRHDPKRGLDVYREQYGSLGLIDPPAGSRTKPPCCLDDGKPLIQPNLLDLRRGL